MKVQAKFTVMSVKKYTGDNVEVELHPVTGGSKENESFWKYTPSGNITLLIQNTEASKQFKPGMDFYVDFTPCDEATDPA